MKRRNLREGMVTEISDIMSAVEGYAQSMGKKFTNVKSDSIQIYEYLKKRPIIQYINATKHKPRDGVLVIQGINISAHVVSRCIGGEETKVLCVFPNN